MVHVKIWKNHGSTLLSVIVDFIGDIISCSPACKTKTVQYNLEEGGIQHQKGQKKVSNSQPSKF